jgi:hypothetical protein
MIMEFCEKGSLERSNFQGRFKRATDGQPEMVSSSAYELQAYNLLLHIVLHTAAE